MALVSTARNAAPKGAMKAGLKFSLSRQKVMKPISENVGSGLLLHVVSS